MEGGRRAEVRRIEVGRIVVPEKGGRERRLSLRVASELGVGHPRMIEVAVGDKVLIHANDRKRGLINSQQKQQRFRFQRFHFSAGFKAS